MLYAGGEVHPPHPPWIRHWLFKKTFPGTVDGDAGMEMPARRSATLPGFAAYVPRTWNRLPTALRSPELSLSSFKRQLKTHSSVPAALDSAGCSCGCRVPSSHRRSCDCTASSAPTTNVHQTRLDSTWTVTYALWTILRYRNRGINLKNNTLTDKWA